MGNALVLLLFDDGSGLLVAYITNLVVVHFLLARLALGTLLLILHTLCRLAYFDFLLVGGHGQLGLFAEHVQQQFLPLGLFGTCIEIGFATQEAGQCVQKLKKAWQKRGFSLD